MEEKLYTTKQVAERLQVTDKTIREWIRSGQLRAVRAGRFWRIKEQDLEAFLKDERGGVDEAERLGLISQELEPRP